MNEAPNPPLEAPDEMVRPWSLRDTWAGFALLLFTQVAILALRLVFKPSKSLIHDYGPLALLLNELIILLPAVIILVWRQADWRALGFGRFRAGFVGLGCSFVMLFYLVSLVNNLAFLRLGMQTQAEEFRQLLRALPSPASFVVTAVILAPLVEETFFRGFLFAGFRQRYGWKKAALLSSVFFAVGHIIPAAMIPAFVIGYAFSYLYHKSGSLWPGIFMHFLINGFDVILLLISMAPGSAIH